MKCEKELAIDEVMVLTNGLNFTIKEACEAGLIVDVVIVNGKVNIVDIKE